MELTKVKSLYEGLMHRKPQSPEETSRERSRTSVGVREGMSQHTSQTLIYFLSCNYHQRNCGQRSWLFQKSPRWFLHSSKTIHSKKLLNDRKYSEIQKWNSRNLESKNCHWGLGKIECILPPPPASRKGLGEVATVVPWGHLHKPFRCLK